jgi:hypothetical protein
MKNIIGWQRNRVSLAAYFAILDRRRDALTPFNIFFSGLPGTAKTEGAMKLAQLLGKTAALVDSSTLDDIAELAGVVDIHANRTLGKNQIILGDLLKAEILVLDEFLNTRPHVMSQYRLMLQGKLTICGNVVPMQTKAIIGTANLSKDMLAGTANEVDSPTADRWALIVEAPSLDVMSSAEIDAIIDDQPYGDFAGVFKRTIASMRKHLDRVEDQSSKPATLYVRTLVSQFPAGSPFACQGRRAKLLKSFVLAAMALCLEEPELDLDNTIWQVVRDCLTYHRLSGLELELPKLQSAHKLSLNILKDAMKNQVEAFVAAESSLPVKLGLLIRHKDQVTAVTKVEVFGQAAGSDDLALLTACRIAVQSPWGKDEPAGMADLLRTAQKPTAEFFESLEGMTPEFAAHWQELSAEERWQWWWRWLNGSYTPELNRFMAEVREHLQSWGLLTTPPQDITEGATDERSCERPAVSSSNP